MQVAKYTVEVAALAQQTKATFDGYQAQHQAFVCHAMQQIMDLQQQKQALESVQSAQIAQNVSLPAENNVLQQPPPPPSLPSLPNLPNLPNLPSLPSLPIPLEAGIFPQGMNPPNPNPNPNASIPPESFLPPMNPSVPPPSLGPPPNGMDVPPPFTQPPPGFFQPPPAAVFPDFSKPPPGFAAPPKAELQEELMPTVPYYDLPTGLMVPLIKVGTRAVSRLRTVRRLFLAHYARLSTTPKRVLMMLG